MDDRSTFEEDLAVNEQLAEDGALPLVMALVSRSMAHSNDVIFDLYDGEKKRNAELEHENALLWRDAQRWRQFVGMVEDTISPFEEA